MKTVFSLAAAMLFVVCSAKENIVIGKNYFSGELRLGIRALPVSANRLHGSRMETDREIRPEERYEPGSDFFLLEYGSPCVFTTDKLREFGAEVKGEYRIQDGALQFDSGKKADGASCSEAKRETTETVPPSGSAADGENSA